MGNFGVRVEGFQLEMAVMEPLADLFRIFQDKIQTIFFWKEYIPPSKFRIRFIRQPVLYYYHLSFFSDDSLVYYVLIGLDKIAMEICLKPPKNLYGNRYKVNNFVGLTASRIGCDPVDERLTG